MPDRDVKTITRTVTISDLTPEEMASVFAGWHSGRQAAFFNALAAEAKGWPGAGWTGQAGAVAADDNLARTGADIIRDLALFVEDRAAKEGWLL